MPEQIAEIAVSGPLRRTFSYSIPTSFGSLEPGQRVLVPFGKQRTTGYYLGKGIAQPDIILKRIQQKLDETSLIQPDLFKLCTWMASYYFANPADCLSLALHSADSQNTKRTFIWSDTTAAFKNDEIAALFKPGKKLSQATISQINQSGKQEFKKLFDAGIIREAWGESKTRNRKDIEKDILDFITPRSDVTTLSPSDEQQHVIKQVTASFGEGFKTFLLHGVTGSGKTLVYCLLCQKLLDQGKNVLVLTPEIALAGTTLSYFRGFFGDTVTVLHSAMNVRERRDSWQGIKSGKYRIVIGPRSALFAPLQNPGLIIVDEEHDGSYKQHDPSPRFNGRDAAIMRAKICNVPVLLGSASPSLESYHHAKTSRYQLLELTKRPKERSLPEIKIIDMKTNRIGGNLPFLSFPLKRAVENCLKADEQIILFLNRRGYSPQLKCTDCGFTPRCPRCEVTLTYHKSGNTLQCHYCGYKEPVLNECPSCKGRDFTHTGAGTQKAEEAVDTLIPDAKIARFDSDSASGRKHAYELLRDFAARKHNILLGTQMVTKGLDLPDVTLVGVLSADANLDLPDFRSSEKTFARLLQVSGRSGRASKPGTVYIQTWYPEHPVILLAAQQQYDVFFEQELNARKALGYPPFSRLINFIISGRIEEKVSSSIVEFREKLEERIKQNNLTVQILGPVPCPLYRLKTEYRRHLFIKTNGITKFTQMLTDWEASAPRFGMPSSVKITVDVDPDDMM